MNDTEHIVRRRSLFDIQNDTKITDQTKITSGLLYTKEYIQQVKAEIEEWTKHLEKNIVNAENERQK